jgi:hypothetical protein
VGVRTVVLMGAPRTGKTALWLTLAAALSGTGAGLRLEDAVGGGRGEGAGERLLWRNAHARFVRLPASRAHGVRVARCALGGERGGGGDAGLAQAGGWPTVVRLVDGPGLTPTAAPLDGELARASAQLLREGIGASVVLAVVGSGDGHGEGDGVARAVEAFARARGIAVERVALAGGATGKVGARLVPAVGADGRPGREARRLATWIAREVVAHRRTREAGG